MIEINLSERDFDYEIQALVNSFFPGQRSVLVICGEERSEYEFADDILLTADNHNTDRKSTRLNSSH